MVAYVFYSLCEQIVTSVRQKSSDQCTRFHNSSPPVLSVSLATGAAPPVCVATLHRHGAENGGDKEAFQAYEQRGE